MCGSGDSVSNILVYSVQREYENEEVAFCIRYKTDQNDLEEYNFCYFNQKNKSHMVGKYLISKKGRSFMRKKQLFGEKYC